MEPSEQQLWDIAHLRAACGYAQLIHDCNMQVGAILVEQRSGNVVSIGINTRVKGRPSKSIWIDPGKPGMAHAEANCLARATINYALNYTLYVTHSPCCECAALILNLPITRVVYSIGYMGHPLSDGLRELEEGGVEVVHCDAGLRTIVLGLNENIYVEYVGTEWETEDAEHCATKEAAHELRQSRPPKAESQQPAAPKVTLLPVANSSKPAPAKASEEFALRTQLVTCLGNRLETLVESEEV